MVTNGVIPAPYFATCSFGVVVRRPFCLGSYFRTVDLLSVFDVQRLGSGFMTSMRGCRANSRTVLERARMRCARAPFVPNVCRLKWTLGWTN